MPRTASRARDDAEEPALTSDQQRALDAIRRQLDAEFGEGEHPGRSMSQDERRRDRGPLRRARPAAHWGALAVVAAFALGGAAGGAGAAFYLMADRAAVPAGAPPPADPAIARPADPRAAAGATPAPGGPGRSAPVTGVERQPVDDRPAQPAADAEEPAPARAPAAAARAAGPEARGERPSAARRADSLALPPRPARPLPARPRAPVDSRVRDIQSR